jgi:mono/diheme cytochrome c family protein
MKLRTAPARRSVAARLAAVAVSAACASAWAQSDFSVVDGYRVDDRTYAGYRVWRAQNCGGCHGAEQQGLTGPALTDSLKRLTREEFERTVREGRPQRRMPGFGHVPQVMEQIDGLYVYLKGRADGVITRAQVEPIKQSNP